MYIHIPIISNKYQEILKQSFLKFPLNKYSIMQIYTNALFPHSVYMYQVCIDVTKGLIKRISCIARNLQRDSIDRTNSLESCHFLLTLNPWQNSRSMLRPSILSWPCITANYYSYAY